MILLYLTNYTIQQLFTASVCFKLAIFLLILLTFNFTFNSNIACQLDLEHALLDFIYSYLLLRSCYGEVMQHSYYLILLTTQKELVSFHLRLVFFI